MKYLLGMALGLGLFLLCGEDTGAKKCSSNQNCYLTQAPPPYNNICLTSGQFQGYCGCVFSSDCWGPNGGQVGVICKQANPTSPPQCVGGCNSTADCNFFNGGPPNTYVCSQNNQCVPYCNSANPCPPGQRCYTYSNPPNPPVSYCVNDDTSLKKEKSPALKK